MLVQKGFCLCVGFFYVCINPQPPNKFSWLLSTSNTQSWQKSRQMTMRSLRRLRRAAACGRAGRPGRSSAVSANGRQVVSKSWEQEKVEEWHQLAIVALKNSKKQIKTAIKNMVTKERHLGTLIEPVMAIRVVEFSNGGSRKIFA